MKLDITQRQWDLFFEQHRDDYETMLRDGRRLAEKFAQDNSNLRKYCLNRLSIDYNYQDYQNKYPTEVSDILSSEYFRAYDSIMRDVAQLRQQSGGEPRNTGAYKPHQQPNTLYEAIHILSYSMMATDCAFTPRSLAIGLNDVLFKELRKIDGDRNTKNVFFPLAYDITSARRISPISPISPDWELRCMQALCGLGFVLLVVAIATWSPMIATVSTVSLLAAAGIYAIRMDQREDQRLPTQHFQL